MKIPNEGRAIAQADIEFYQNLVAMYEDNIRRIKEFAIPTTGNDELIADFTEECEIKIVKLKSAIKKIKIRLQQAEQCRSPIDEIFRHIFSKMESEDRDKKDSH